MKLKIQRTIYALTILCSVAMTGCEEVIVNQAQSSFAAFLTSVATTLINTALTQP